MNYAAAWRQLQTQLAAKYDTNPLIQEIAVTSCTSFSAEPFFLPDEHVGVKDEPLPDTTMPALHEAGYNDATYQQLPSECCWRLRAMADNSAGVYVQSVLRLD